MKVCMLQEEDRDLIVGEMAKVNNKKGVPLGQAWKTKSSRIHASLINQLSCWNGIVPLYTTVCGDTKLCMLHDPHTLYTSCTCDSVYIVYIAYTQ